MTTRKGVIVSRPIQSLSSPVSSCKPESSGAPGGPLRKTLHFVDGGQDFLEWDLDARGVVIDCRPFQAWVWKGTRLTGKPVAGQHPRIVPPSGSPPMTLAYAIERIVLHKQKGRA